MRPRVAAPEPCSLDARHYHGPSREVRVKLNPDTPQSSGRHPRWVSCRCSKACTAVGSNYPDVALVARHRGRAAEARSRTAATTPRARLTCAQPPARGPMIAAVPGRSTQRRARSLNRMSLGQIEDAQTAQLRPRSAALAPGANGIENDRSATPSVSRERSGASEPCEHSGPSSEHQCRARLASIPILPGVSWSLVSLSRDCPWRSRWRLLLIFWRES
jgi:hypothetical protein